MRRLPLPRLMHFHPLHPMRGEASARVLMASDWAKAFPKPRRRRLKFTTPKKAA